MCTWDESDPEIGPVKISDCGSSSCSSSRNYNYDDDDD